MIGEPESWVDEVRGIGYVRARYRADQNGVNEAEEALRTAARDGFEVVDISHSGEGIDLTKTGVKSAVGLGLLGLTGFGFVGTSRKRGEIVITWGKVY